MNNIISQLPNLARCALQPPTRGAALSATLQAYSYEPISRKSRLSRSSQTLRSKSGPTHRPQPNPPLSYVFQPFKGWRLEVCGNVDHTKTENTLSVTAHKVQPLLSGVLLVRFQNKWFEQRVVQDSTNTALFVECRPLSRQIEAINSEWLNNPDSARGCNGDLI